MVSFPYFKFGFKINLGMLMVLPAHQFGVGQNTGIDLAHLLLGETCAFARHNKLNIGVLYLDMVGAFDSIHRQLIYGTTRLSDEFKVDTSSEGEPETLPSGVTVRLAHQLTALFQRQPLLQHPGVPAVIGDILRESNTAVWTQLPQ
eukprot:600214-Amphidinium_carterae.1